jgi:hypothetical protein
LSFEAANATDGRSCGANGAGQTAVHDLATLLGHHFDAA